jgi:hypothetical protein
MKWTLVVLLGLSGASPAFAATIDATCPTLAADLHNAAAGDVVLLPDETCDVVSLTLRPASGITIRGGPTSVLRASFPGTTSLPLFDLSGLSSIEVVGFGVQLGVNAVGFRANPGGIFRFRDLRVRGNLLTDDNSSLAFDLRNVPEIEATDITIEENFGGFYANFVGRLLVERLRTRKVNFGNLVISGANVIVRNPTFEDPGYPSASHHPSGDAITLGEVTDILIDGAYFLRGRCYFIYAPRGLVTRLTVRNSTFTQGATSAIRLLNVADSDVTHNTFRDNGGHGVALTKAANVTVSQNVFRRETMYVGESTSGVYTDNTFINAGLTPYRIIGTNDVTTGNRIVP